MHTEHDDLRLLRALCQSADAALIRRACHALRNRRWTQAEYAVVFDACAALAACGVRIRRGNLASQLTRAGFPDIDLEALFAPLPAPDRELAHRLDALQEEEG